MEYILVAVDDTMKTAWEEFFSNESNVTIVIGDITKVVVDAIVSPANSFGFMDGGVDYAISERLGWDLHERLQQQIKELPEGELLIGRALVMDTNDKDIPYLITAPTMRVPMKFNIATSVNAYLAAKAAIIAAKNHPQIQTVAFTGMCTGIGKMKPQTSALQMYQAFLEIEKKQKLDFEDFVAAQKQQISLNPDGMIFD